MLNKKIGTTNESNDRVDNMPAINNNLINHVKSAASNQLHYRPKKFAIFGTKISESNLDLNTSNFINMESNEQLEKILEKQTPRATEILGRILQNNLNTYNQLINYNYKTKIKNHDDIIKNNRLNFLLGMRKNEKIFSIRPASLNDLNERLGQVYSVNTYSNAETNNSQTKIIYNLSKKHNQQNKRSNNSSSAHKADFNSASIESLKKLPGFELLKKIALVDFNDEENQN